MIFPNMRGISSVFFDRRKVLSALTSEIYCTLSVDVQCLSDRREKCRTENNTFPAEKAIYSYHKDKPLDIGGKFYLHRIAIYKIQIKMKNVAQRTTHFLKK